MAILLAILLAGQILLCLYLLGTILLRRSLCKQVMHWFVVNAVVANLLFSLIVRPGTIHEFEQLTSAENYCRVYNILHHIEQVCIPAMLLMFTLDRMVYVRNPNVYGQRMSLAVVLVLLILPWAVSLIIGVVCAYGFAGKNMLMTASPVYGDINGTISYCWYNDEHSKFYTGMLIFEALASLAVALASLIVTVLVLCFYFRYKRALTFNQAYCQLEVEVTPYVKDATVSVCLLNLLFLIVFVSHFLVMEFCNVSFDSHAIYFIFEFFEMLILLFTLTDVRRTTYQGCCKRAQRETTEQQATLRYVASAEEAQ